MWKELTFQLKSQAPLILHNGQMASPLNKYAKLLKAISSKRSKTDADYEEMARIEFMASLYVGDRDGNKALVMPMENLMATMINGAKKRKEGMTAKSGTYIPRYAYLEYEGEQNPDKMWEHEEFRFEKLVRVGQAKVMRTRPILPTWGMTMAVVVEDTVVTPERVSDWLSVAGREVGFCDWRPQYGRFSVEQLT